jgi:PKD repeat protein
MSGIFFTSLLILSIIVLAQTGVMKTNAAPNKSKEKLRFEATTPARVRNEVIDNNGFGNFASENSNIAVPVADPNGPYTGTVGSPVVFDGSGSFDFDGTIVAFDWVFGDGSTGNGFSPTHTYASPDIYSVSLVVTDDDGLTDIAASTVEITGVIITPPVADPNGPYTGTIGSPVTFDGSGSVDPDGTILSYDWDFGDGNTGTGVSPTHVYASIGAYTVSLSVTDNDGATDSATTAADITEVINTPPVADPNGPYSEIPFSPVSFDGSGSFDSDGTIVSYDWDFDGGITGTGINPTHEYTSPGIYSVTLTVTDDDGATDSAITTAIISTIVPPVSDPNGPYTGIALFALTFDGSGSYDSDGTIVSYDWEFGDGNTGTGVSPTHTYASTGTYSVLLSVTDNDGITNSALTYAEIV